MGQNSSADWGVSIDAFSKKSRNVNNKSTRTNRTYIVVIIIVRNVAHVHFQRRVHFNFDFVPLAREQVLVQVYFTSRWDTSPARVPLSQMGRRLACHLPPSINGTFDRHHDPMYRLLSRWSFEIHSAYRRIATVFNL